MNARDDALEEAAVLCDSSANLYAEYAKQLRRTFSSREAFVRDHQTCADMARRIRALKTEIAP